MDESTSKPKLKLDFQRASITGQQAFKLSGHERKRLAIACLQKFEELAANQDGTHGVQSFANVIQPLFALSGYRLIAQRELAGNHRFDLVGENLIGGSDRILVDYKFSRNDAPRSIVPSNILAYARGFGAASSDRIIMISNGGFDPKAMQAAQDVAGPRFEFWSYNDVRAKLEVLQTEAGSADRYVTFVLEFLDKLAFALAENEIRLQCLEWREVERLVAHVLQGLGYAVHLTRGSKDDGKDVIVADVSNPEFGVFNIEVKHWITGKAGAKEARRTLDVAFREKREGALLLATSGVSQAAVEARGESNLDFLRFGDESKIVLTCRAFARKGKGLWMAPEPLKTFLLEGTS
ncbi:MAG: restriction endonuclease [Rhizobiaceae bacterium]